MHKFSNLFFGIKLYVFRAVPLSIIRSFSLYTQQWYMSYRLADSYHLVAPGIEPETSVSVARYPDH